jgi:hypothetical protein
MPPRHVEDLFSVACDGRLSEQQQRRFEQHLRDCDACRAAYERFQAGVDAVRALPAARMPRAVHLPSTPPVAERRALGRVRWASLLRYRTGMATGLAAAAAVAVVAVAATHQTGTTGGGAGSAAGALSRQPSKPGAAADQFRPDCPQPAPVTAASPPSGFDHRNLGTDPARPGQQLLVATPAGQVEPGARLPVFAVLTAPLPQVGAAPAGKSVASVAAVPCLTATGIAEHGDLRVENGVNSSSQSNPSPAAPRAAGGPQPIFYVDVPASAPPGTVLRITAMVPSGYPDSGDPPLSVELTITVH